MVKRHKIRNWYAQIFGAVYGRGPTPSDNDIIGAMLDNMLAHNARNQDIYILEAGLGEETSFSGLPIIMEALAQDRRRSVQGIIDRAIAADDVAYDARAQTLTFSDGRESFVIKGVTRNPISATVTSAELMDSDSVYNQVIVRLTLAGRTQTTRNVEVDADNARSMQSVLPYSLLVTDADYDTGSQCGAIAQDYCIAAPHTYTYHNTNTNRAVEDATSNHAPAALVAGGVALMQQIFDGQLTSAQIVDRLLRTASQNFDLDGDGENDYVNDKANPDGDDLKEAAERFGQGLLDLECAVRPVFKTGDDARCRRHVVAETQDDCLSQGWGWDDDTAQCVTATKTGAADTCSADDSLQFIDGVGCRPTAMLCKSLGQVYAGVDMTNPRCVATGADCPTGQGVQTSDATGSQCVAATEATCLAARRGFNGTNCVARAVCTASQIYVAANNTCANTPPTQATQCAEQGWILNLGGAGNEDNRCVDSVTECGAMQTVNAAGDTCVAATGACVAPMGYDAITKECVMTPTRVTQCTSIGRILGTSASANVDGCVADATDCATDFAAQDGLCIAKIECVRLGQGYDASTKMCVSASLMADDCYAASTESVLNVAGDKCLTSRFYCGANQAAIGDTTAGFACAAAATACTGGQGYDSTNRVCVPMATVTAPQCAAVKKFLLRAVGGGCAEMCAATDGLNEATSVCTSSPTGVQCQANNNARLRDSGCVASCMDADGYNSATFTCVTSGQTGAQCQANGSKVKSTSAGCVDMCTAAQGLSSSSVCLAAPSSGTECQANGGRLLRNSGCVSTCEANDGLRDSHTCVTSNATVGECTANNALLNAGQRTCISRTGCTGMSDGNRYINSDDNTCVAMCASGEGRSADGECIASSSVAAADCNRGGQVLATGGGCADACDAAEGLNAGTFMCTSSPTGVQCQANNNARLRDSGCVASCMDADGYNSATFTCVTSGQTGAQCQANGSKVKSTSAGCVDMCTAAQGLSSSSVCLAAPSSGTECQANGGRLLRNSGCVSTCEANDGLRDSHTCVTSNATADECTANNALLNAGQRTCISRTGCTGMSDGNRYINSDDNTCVAMCASGEGRSADGECIASSSVAAADCNRGGQVLATSGGCADACDAAEGLNAATFMCTSSPTGVQCQANNNARLRDSGCVASCMDADGYNSATFTCVTSGQTGAQCQANGSKVKSTSAGCVDMCTAAQGLSSSSVCLAAPSSGTECQANGGRLLRNSGCVSTCEANDGLRDSHTCVTSNATADECTANGALLNAGQRTCISRTGCTGMSDGNRYINSDDNTCVAMCASGEGRSADGECIASSSVAAADCNRGGQVLATSGGCADACDAAEGLNAATFMCTSSPTGVQCQANNNARLRDSGCVASCMDADGYNSATFTCVTSGQTGAQCQANGSKVKSTSAGCVDMCTAAQGLSSSSVCLAAPSSGTECQANGGRLLRNSGCVSTCEANDGLRDSHTCVTSNATVDECTANNALLNAGQRTCISRTGCTGMSDGNRYINSADNTCVAMCASGEGRSADGECIASSSVAAADCNRGGQVLATDGECADACDAAEGLNTGTFTCTASGLNGTLCDANGGRVYNSNTSACETAMTCTDRSGDSALRFISNMQCVNSCPANQGINASDECVSSALTGQFCLNAGRVLRSSNCVDSCAAAEGLRAGACVTSGLTGAECDANGGRVFNSGAGNCETATACTARSGDSAYRFISNMQCVNSCPANEGVNASDECVSTALTGQFCLNAGRVLSGGNCVSGCAAAEGLRAGACVTSGLDGAACDANGSRVYNSNTSACETAMTCTARTGGSAYRFISNMQCVNSCPANEGVNASDECVSTALTGQFCLDAGRVLSGGNCVAGCAAAEGLRAGACVTSGLDGAACDANGSRVYNSNTSACETAMTCTARSGGSAHRFISNMQCVNSCPANEGVNASDECVSTALTGQFCLNAGRVLSGGNCVSGCAAAEGLRAGACVTSGLDGAACDSNGSRVYNSRTRVCETVMTCTDRNNGRRFISSMECVGACPTNEGVDGDGMCTASSLTAAHCGRGDRFLRGGNCVDDCPATEGINSGQNRCVASPNAAECFANDSAFLRGSGCVAMCEAADGKRGTNTCVTDGSQTGAECQANGSARLRSGGCVASCMDADGYNGTTFTCVTSGQTGEQCQANGTKVLATTGGCVAMCTATQGLSSAFMCLASPSSGAECDANGGRVYNSNTSACETAMTCTDRTGDSALRFISAMQCVNSCPANEGVNNGECTSTALTGQFCLDAGRVLSGGNCVDSCAAVEGLRAGACVTSGLTGAECDANGGRVFNSGAGNCETATACTARSGDSAYRFISNMQCVNSCPANEGVNASDECVSTALTEQFCLNAGRVLSGGNCVSGCAAAEGLRAGACVTTVTSAAECAANGALLRMGGTTCITRTGCTGMTAGIRYINVAETTCVSECAAGQGLTNADLCTAMPDADACGRVTRVLLSSNTCGAAGDCAAGQGVQDDACTAYASLRDKDAGCSLAGRVDGGRACSVPVSSNEIIEAFRGAGNIAETSDLIDSSGFDGDSTTAQKRQAEYANQPSLDIVGAAFAYGKAGAGAVGIDAAIAKAGAGSNISVITNRRFDPTHPEFSSSANDATFDTLTRFYVQFSGVDTPAAVIPAVFDTDEAKARVQLYRDSFGYNGFDVAWATIRVPNLGSVTFERVSRDAFDASGNGAVRTALETLLKSVTGGTLVDKTNSHKLTKDSRGRYYFSFSGDTAGSIGLTNFSPGFSFNHVGRVYTDGGNIGSYQIFMNVFPSRDNSDSGECVVDNACYARYIPAAASGAEMGILALIKGLANPTATGVAYNTHGIAPGATLNVFTAPAAGATGHGVDAIYRARGIDVARDSGADKDRNIVIINNNMASIRATGAVTSSALNTLTTGGWRGEYKTIYETLQVGLANNDKQDAYVFAARDGGAADVGLLAALPISTRGTSISDYSIIVVAAEKDQTPCGANTDVQAICIAAPGEYRYRDRHSTTGVYETTLSTATSANAAASLVAGGLALLESIFSGETTARLIDRLLMTASKDYDLNNDYTNDYTAQKHGQGLMDLACAIRPTLNSGPLARTGCTDRFATPEAVSVSSNDIIEVFRGAGNTAETSALASVSGIKDRSRTADKRRLEYANQRSLDVVGAAFAYGKAGDGTATGIDAAIAKAGAGSNISVVTNRRFDPTHPEFSSAASDATFDTLTRFYVWALGVDTPPTTLAAFIPAVFGTGDEAKARVQLYRDRFNSRGESSATIQVPNVGSVTFESISRDAFNSNSAVRTALETFLKSVVDGTLVDKTNSHKLTKNSSGNYYFAFNGDGSDLDGYIPLTNAGDQINFNHVGRVYTDGGNIGSYQIVTGVSGRSASAIRGGSHSGECVADNDCYTSVVSAAASGAEMGILALINGLANPDATGVAYNTHGIAPGATLNVITAPAVGASWHIGADTIYRARGIDFVRDSGADKDRNIVIINNNMVSSRATGAFVSPSNVNTITTSGGAYKTMYETLQVGLANNDKQDAYVFAAADGRSNDVGLLAALPISTHGTSISDYSIIVVAAEADQTPCGSGSSVRAICIAAPGEYQYRDRNNDGTYATTLSTATSANAAASLVAGGLALLESIFSGETTARLIDRLLKTASKSYDLNNDKTNDYTGYKHGQGLMDLACAVKPGLSAALSRTGCVDRLAVTAAECNQGGQVLTTSGSCADMCGAAEGLNAGTHTCTASGLNGTLCHANGGRVYNSNTSACETAMTCTDRTGGSAHRFISAMQCVNSCPANEGVNNGECTSTALTGQFCLDAGRVLSGSDCVAGCATAEGLRAGVCVTGGLTGAECDANGSRVYNSNTSACETAMACTARSGDSALRFISNMQCVNSCPANEGVNNGECTSTALTGQFCLDAGRVLSGSNCVSGCMEAEGLRAGVCIASGATAGDCVANGLLLNSGLGTCIARSDCIGMSSGNQYVNVAAATCVATCGTGEGVVDNNCVSVASLTDSEKTAACLAADREVVGMICGVGANTIIEAFRGAGNIAETSDLIDSSGFDDDSTTAQKRQVEYANQPSLDIVGAAFAYGKAREGAVDIDAALGAGFGTGSNISVITSKRFDPTHPEFSSSANNAKFDTLTRFFVWFQGVDMRPTTRAAVIPAFFDTDEAKARVQLYRARFRNDGDAYVTIQVPNLGSVTFESISRDAFDANGNGAVRTALETFLQKVVDGTQVVKSGSHKLLSRNGRYYFAFNGDASDLDGNIRLTSSSARFNFSHVGRVYTDGGNIGSYQIVMNTGTGLDRAIRDDSDSGECITNEDCYGEEIVVPVAASGAEMGILALINGLMNPDATGVAYNTHGIAPGATLNVVTTPAAGATGHISADTIYRARGIDVARDVSSENVIADKDRNIVIINNNMATSFVTGAVTQVSVNTITTTPGSYRPIYETLQVGLADNDKQDAYVFAAADGRRNDVGIFAAMPISTHGTSIVPYSIIVVAAEGGQTPCGGNPRVQAICIAAPGEYKYRERNYDGTYETTLSTATSANAAASLVAGGLALLESIFSGETTARLIDRLLKTASKKFNFDDPTGVSQYTIDKHGQGLMDLACAIRPVFSTGDLVRDDCVDRYPSVTVPIVSSNEIIEVFRGAGNTAETSDLIDSSRFDGDSTTAQKRQREYANQPSLDIVGAAFAYGKAGAGATDIDAAIAKAGAGSNISVVTSKRFDPNHPDFSSSSDYATFDTLTRFYVSCPMGRYATDDSGGCDTRSLWHWRRG